MCSPLKVSACANMNNTLFLTASYMSGPQHNTTGICATYRQLDETRTCVWQLTSWFWSWEGSCTHMTQGRCHRSYLFPAVCAGRGGTGGLAWTSGSLWTLFILSIPSFSFFLLFQLQHNQTLTSYMSDQWVYSINNIKQCYFLHFLLCTELWRLRWGPLKIDYTR